MYQHYRSTRIVMAATPPVRPRPPPIGHNSAGRTDHPPLDPAPIPLQTARQAAAAEQLAQHRAQTKHDLEGRRTVEIALGLPAGAYREDAAKRKIRARLLRQGYSDEDVDLALATQAAEQKVGLRRRSIEQIIAGRAPNRLGAGAPAAELTARQLRVRGRYGQAALLVDQQALLEQNEGKKALARDLSTSLKLLSGRAIQLEFDFFMANTSIGHQYFDAITARLGAEPITLAQRMAATTTLAHIMRWLGWQSHVCLKTQTELAAITGVKKQAMSKTIDLLERVGAVTRTKRGSMKVITVTPEGAYRGDITRHADAVHAYQAEVVPFGKRQLKSQPSPYTADGQPSPSDV